MLEIVFCKIEEKLFDVLLHLKKSFDEILIFGYSFRSETVMCNLMLLFFELQICTIITTIGILSFLWNYLAYLRRCANAIFETLNFYKRTVLYLH